MEPKHKQIVVKLPGYILVFRVEVEGLHEAFPPWRFGFRNKALMVRVLFCSASHPKSS